jgi:enhancing lycopene biosynthesis protein 2
VFCLVDVDKLNKKVSMTAAGSPMDYPCIHPSMYLSIHLVTVLLVNYYSH